MLKYVYRHDLPGQIYNGFICIVHGKKLNNSIETIGIKRNSFKYIETLSQLVSCCQSNTN